MIALHKSIRKGLLLFCAKTLSLFFPVSCFKRDVSGYIHLSSPCATEKSPDHPDAEYTKLLTDQLCIRLLGTPAQYSAFSLDYSKTLCPVLRNHWYGEHPLLLPKFHIFKNQVCFLVCTLQYVFLCLITQGVSSCQFLSFSLSLFQTEKGCARSASLVYTFIYSYIIKNGECLLLHLIFSPLN